MTDESPRFKPSLRATINNSKQNTYQTSETTGREGSKMSEMSGGMTSKRTRADNHTVNQQSREYFDHK